MFYANSPVKDKMYDDTLKAIVDSLKKKIIVWDDDGLIIICGSTGTGKSNLLLHLEDEYLGDKSDIGFVALTKEELADTQYDVQNTPMPRFLGYDEANVNKRDSLTRWNKDLIDLYMANRGKNILHVWCNPSIDYLDKVFINERVIGVIFVATKSKDRPRLYYYFTKRKLLELYEKEENLKQRTLRKNAHKFAMYCGWFRAYKGDLLEPYLFKKNQRMDDKSLDFKNRWGNKVSKADLLSINKIGKELLLKDGNALRPKHDLLVENGLLVKDKHFFITPSEQILYTKECISIFKDNYNLHKNNTLTPKNPLNNKSVGVA